MKIEVQHLCKHFGNTRAVDDVSFSFTSGDVLGFIGPNGAGKTTTMRILATLDEPTSGDALVEGVSLVERPEQARRFIGYVPDTLPTHRDINVHEYIDFFARAYGVKGERRRQVVTSIEEFTNLTGIREKMLSALSKGMKQRVSLARALVHDPPVLLMDEPAAGLDPRARIELRELVKILSTQGKAILISSHILTELSEICTGAVIIEQGRLLKAGNLDDVIREDVPKRTVLIRHLGEPADLCKHLLEMPGVENASLVDHHVSVEVHGADEACSQLLTSLIQGGFRIVEFRQKRVDLEQVFMNVTKGVVQ
jgi:ABC-2 type transport system ATP-binding protein